MRSSRHFVTGFLIIVLSLVSSSLAQQKPLPVPSLPMKWSDLVGHQEYCAMSCKLTTSMETRDGTKIPEGTEVYPFGVARDAATVMTADMVQLSVTGDQCDLLDASNKYMATLQPIQRMLSIDRLWRDISLQPAKVKVFANVCSPDKKKILIPAGSEVLCGMSVNYTIPLWIEDEHRFELITQCMTDFVDRSRKIFITPRNQRPGRVAFQLEGRTVDADGKPMDVKHAAFYLMLFGSSSDAKTADFLPKLLEAYKSKLADRKDVAVVMLTTDKSNDDILKFAKEKEIPFAIVLADRVPGMFLEWNPQKQAMALVATDRFDNVGMSTTLGKAGNESPEGVLSRFVKSMEKNDSGTPH